MLERDLVRKSAINHGHEIAYHDRDGHRTWAEMDDRSDRLARVLADLGVAKGMRTAILSSNRIEVAEHWFACLKTGMVRVGINWRYSAADMLHVIRDSDARVILVETENSSCCARMSPSSRPRGGASSASAAPTASRSTMRRCWPRRRGSTAGRRSPPTMSR